MMRKSKAMTVVLLISFCLSLLAGPLWAVSPEKLRPLKDEEVAKIKDAMPTALEIMGEKTGAFDVTVVTDDYSVFTADTLKQFDIVCLNNTTGLKFDPSKTPERCKALMDFVKSGKGLVGIHAAADNFYQWPEGMEMMGNKFTGHPWGAGGTWAIKIDEPDHPLTAPFKGKGFKVKDEIYRTDPPLYSRDKQLVLMSLDMSDPTTKAQAQKPEDADTGITWVKKWGRGRVFYCSLGHNNEIFWTPAILEHYLRGIQFAAGDFDVATKPKASVKGSDMEQQLEKVKTYDYGQSRAALTELSDHIRQAYGKPAELKKIEKALLGVLKSDAKYAGKQYVCRELSIIGTEQSVPVLASMLTDEKYSDMARYALERIPGNAADEALLAALSKANGKPKIGIVNRQADGRFGQAAGRRCDQRAGQDRRPRRHEGPGQSQGQHLRQFANAGLRRLSQVRRSARGRRQEGGGSEDLPRSEQAGRSAVGAHRRPEGYGQSRRRRQVISEPRGAPLGRLPFVRGRRWVCACGSM